VAFQDHFSADAASYGQARPDYPPALAAHLAAVAPSRGVVLDLATGNGQAALLLARHFDRVLASDASAAQLAEARPHARVTYLRHAAESLPVRAAVVDLIAVAQAAHWLDLDRLYAEARRVLRPGGVVALWTYSTPRLGADFDLAIDAFYAGRVGRYWPPERRHVESGYRTLAFPFRPVPAPAFELVERWTLDRFLAYVGTWSAVTRCRAAEGRDPLPELARSLAGAWGGEGLRTVRWPIHLLLGRVDPI
jgi:SAM-dependent methyltransferase